MKKAEIVINPSKKELITLRIIILVGIIFMFLFLKGILKASTENKPLYWMLAATIIFSCIKIVYEWIHYFSITVPPTPKSERLFTVDIFTTFCAGEPYEMIEETLVAIKAISYPHQTFLCDESDDPYLKAFCNDLGIFHITRKVKINAKAGNINNALKSSSAELCVILDPDHVPFPDFLDPIVSHFNDPDIGFVQIVQSYKNYDQTLIAKGAAQQTFQFYGPIMMTMNKYGTVLAIGANCTFRRAALDSIGGHAPGLAEDMHTAMQLHAKGWKSIYVPAVLARGLVPSTLTAYYSQQLKWSRGVFELLVTSYVSLFRKFTWQQKLHYGTIPLHYLSGVVILINFLIPVFSLFFNTSPMNMDFLNFLTLIFPFVTFTFLIRLYVQKWVMEEEERGFHIVGGLLLIGTWWIFLLGLFYTIIRKKIPYIPTPKDDTEESNIRFNIPNLFVIALSLIAIAYGLHSDWNPYNLIMAGFAAINCLILLFTVVASRQLAFRKIRDKNRVLASFMMIVRTSKIHFWKFRRYIYKVMRSTALLLTLLFISLAVYRMNTKFDSQDEVSVNLKRKNILIPGIFAPEQADGLSSLKLVRGYEAKGKIHFGIISFYIAWGDQPRCDLPLSKLDSVYKQNSIPMITWEPWQVLFKKTDKVSKDQKEKKVFAKILNGEYDQYLDKFSKQIKSLNRPIFIRFAHEMDNPQYPWSEVGDNTPEEFKSAWQYVHNYFLKNQAYNVIWVWNPWRPETVQSYFPGKDYVDWLGVTNLNYDSENGDKQSYSSEHLYQQFHSKNIFRSGLPVMLAETGSLQSGNKNAEWLNKGVYDASTKFPEVKAIVIFNSGLDQNTLDGNKSKPLDWRIQNFNSFELSLQKSRKEQFWLSNQFISPPANERSTRLDKKLIHPISNKLIKGVNYVKGRTWSTNGHALKKEEISNDMSEMKKAGINSIKYASSEIYDYNILNAAREQGIQVTYSFTIPHDVDYVSGIEKLSLLSAKILKTINSQIADKNIIMWNIGNTPFTDISNNYLKPDLLYPRERLILWLKKLVNDIKAIDPARPVSIDLDAGNHLLENAEIIHNSIPAVDAIGVVVHNDLNFTDLIKRLNIPYFISSISASEYVETVNDQPDTFIANWQDEMTENHIAFNGLKDYTGKGKYEFYRLGKLWGSLKVPEEIPMIKILLPAVTVVPNTALTYNALIYKDDWHVANGKEDLKFEWKLVKNDKMGHPIRITTLGEGPMISVTIPENPASYSLYLYISNSSQVKIIESKLNTPLSTK